MAQTVEIRGNFDKQNGETAVAGKVFFTLSKRDFDNTTVIETMTQEAELGADGSFTGLMVWPNDRGRVGSRYKIEFQRTGANKTDLISDSVLVPETGGPHQLADLIFAAEMAKQLKLAGIIPISPAEYSAKLADGSLVENTLYVVEAA